jgi:hypothetical protein
MPTKWRRHPPDPRALPPATLLGSSFTSPGAISQNAVHMGRTALRVFRHHLDAVRAISTPRACSWSAARFCAWYVPRLRRAVWQSLRTGDIPHAGRALVLLARLAKLRVELRVRVIGSAA